MCEQYIEVKKAEFADVPDGEWMTGVKHNLVAALKKGASFPVHLGSSQEKIHENMGRYGINAAWNTGFVAGSCIIYKPLVGGNFTKAFCRGDE